MTIAFYNFIKEINTKILFIDSENAFEFDLFKKMKYI